MKQVQSPVDGAGPVGPVITPAGPVPVIKIAEVPTEIALANLYALGPTIPLEAKFATSSGIKGAGTA